LRRCGHRHGVTSVQAEVDRSTCHYRFAVNTGLELEAMVAELVLELEVDELVHSAVSYKSCLDR